MEGSQGRFDLGQSEIKWARCGWGGDARRTALSPVASVSSNERSPTLANFTAPTLGAIVVRQMPSAQ